LPIRVGSRSPSQAFDGKMEIASSRINLIQVSGSDELLLHKVQEKLY
jgi:hypothetical protein